MRRTAARAFAALALATTLPLASLGVLAPASASQQPGVTYVGLTGSAGVAGPFYSGARVELDVSADGLSVTRLAVFDVPLKQVDGCALTKFSYTFTGNAPITTPAGHPPTFHGFTTYGTGIPLQFDGSFDPGGVGGRFTYKDPLSPCATPASGVTFSASAPGGCLGSPEHAALQVQYDAAVANVATIAKKLKKAKKAYKKALKTHNAAAIERTSKKVTKLKRKLRVAKAKRDAAADDLAQLCS